MGYLAGALLAAVRLPGSRRAWLLIGLALNAVCLAAMATTSSLPLFPPVALAAGIASAFCLIFQLGASARPAGRRRPQRTLGLHFAGVGIGIAVSAALVATLGAWQSMWLASAALALVAAAGVVVMVPAEDAPSSTAAGAAARNGYSTAFMILARLISCSASATSSPRPS